MWQAYRFFEKKVRQVAVRGDDGLIVLSITWSDPETAARWANELIQQANEKIRAEAILEAKKSIAYLEEQLAATSALELQQGIYRLIENNLNKIMLANVRDEFAFKVLDAAAAPDRNDFDSPNRIMIIGAGGLLGLFLALLFALTRGSSKKQ